MSDLRTVETLRFDSVQTLSRAQTAVLRESARQNAFDCCDLHPGATALCGHEAEAPFALTETGRDRIKLLMMKSVNNRSEVTCPSASRLALAWLLSHACRPPKVQEAAGNRKDSQCRNGDLAICDQIAFRGQKGARGRVGAGTCRGLLYIVALFQLGMHIRRLRTVG